MFYVSRFSKDLEDEIIFLICIISSFSLEDFIFASKSFEESAKIHLNDRVLENIHRNRAVCGSQVPRVIYLIIYSPKKDKQAAMKAPFALDSNFPVLTGRI